MLRRLSSCLAAVLVVAGLVAATPATAAVAPAVATVTAAAPVTPHGGTYVGRDRARRQISFTYAPHLGQVLHFVISVAGAIVEHADVVDGRVGVSCTEDEQLAQHRCFRLEWTSDGEVTGFWGPHRGVTTPFTATLQAPPHPARGVYVGSARLGAEGWSQALSQKIAFVFNPDSGVGGFAFDPYAGYGGWIGDVGLPVTGSHHHFEGCGLNLCVKGHWQTNRIAVGVARHNHGAQLGWHPWEAYLDGIPAFSSAR